MCFLVDCLTESYEVSDISWQWLLGRLYIVERLVIDFPTEFLPRQRPDGASSESSLELVGAKSKDDEEERPENYDRLLLVAQFSIKAVSNPHARISRVAKRVFLLAARYAAHLENLMTELTKLTDDLDFAHKKSLKKQLEKIVADFQLSEQIGRQLHIQNRLNPDDSPDDTPNMTPLSTPRCTSPVTVMSDAQSEAESSASKMPLIVPPNTPIRDRRRHLKDESRPSSFDLVNENEEIVEEVKMQHLSKSLDNLNSDDCRPRSRLAKSPLKSSNRNKKSSSRSRSRTPQRMGPVLETNLDEVIKLEESRQRINSFGKLNRNMKITAAHVDDEDDDIDDNLSFGLDPVVSDTSGSLAVSPPSRLLSHDLETDIDSVEPDLDILLKQKWNSCDNVFDAQFSVDETHSVGVSKKLMFKTPKKKSAKIPSFLSLDLKGDKSPLKSKRSISPCAHVLELERMSSMTNISTSPPLDPLSQVKTLRTETKGQESDKKLAKKTKCEDMTSSKAQTDIYTRQHTSSPGPKTPERPLSASYRSDESLNYSATTPCTGKEKPVSFRTEVAMATPKHSPSHTLDKGIIRFASAVRKYLNYHYV